MIPKLNRINREDFEKILKKGRLQNSGLFSLRFLENPYNTTNIGVVVSKKVAKTAVSRNKIRRRAYSLVQKYLKPLKPPYFLAFFAKKGAEKAAFKEVEAEISDLLQKAKIL